MGVDEEVGRHFEELSVLVSPSLLPIPNPSYPPSYQHLVLLVENSAAALEYYELGFDSNSVVGN